MSRATFTNVGLDKRNVNSVSFRNVTGTPLPHPFLGGPSPRVRICSRHPQGPRAGAARRGAVRRRARRLDRQRRPAVDRVATSTSPRTTSPGSSTPTRSPSAASCCWAAAWPTCSAAGACSSPASSSSPPPRWPAASPRARAGSIAARAVQGLGAAMLSPAALSIVTMTFAEGAERNRALGVWGAVAGSGGAAGVLLGGMLTECAGWEWVLFVNVPIGLAAALLAPRILPESRISGPRHFDVAGAISVTAGLSLLVYALVDANNAGWGSTQTLSLIAVSLALIARFVAIERRTRAPARPLRDLPQPDADRRQRHRAAGRDVAVLDVLLRLAVHAAGARLQRAEGRPRLPAAGLRDHRLGRHRLGARDALRLQAGAGRGAAPDRRRAGLVRPDLAGRQLRHRHPARRRCSPRSASASRSCR